MTHTPDLTIAQHVAVLFGEKEKRGDQELMQSTFHDRCGAIRQSGLL